MPKSKSVEDRLEEHQFIATALKVGLTINDLKELKYKDVAKIMLCFVEKDKKKATQSDIDRFLG